jgi:hypothetical protein
MTGYLICRKRKDTKAHIWDGEDTLCTMVSRGELYRENCDVHSSPMDREICFICLARDLKSLATSCEHGVVDWWTCPDCRQPTERKGSE